MPWNLIVNRVDPGFIRANYTDYFRHGVTNQSNVVFCLFFDDIADSIISGS